MKARLKLAYMRVLHGFVIESQQIEFEIEYSECTWGELVNIVETTLIALLSTLQWKCNKSERKCYICTPMFCEAIRYDIEYISANQHM